MRGSVVRGGDEEASSCSRVVCVFKFRFTHVLLRAQRFHHDRAKFGTFSRGFFFLVTVVLLEHKGILNLRHEML